ncbi:3-hydroxyisobutyryl- hydrolase [Ophiostoma piceae UAMH 11346]|uniref:3-hydroxyisobutyryl-CoA hydrolase n=1 Tax=Ophiostoma piceae (strain UAMH 11346) TaxID=1262450 RepID=S3CW58_OPHP1|nr:3-hydroxyisobutyryl- hydrolase [Ophiostoma piceae UAMH 11346]
MPLRARILVPRPMARAMSTTTSTSKALWKELPEDEAEDVLFSSIYGLRTVELNRPGKYNSLNASMIRKIAPRLLEWEKSDMANVIVVKGAGDKAFCAGGDVTALAESNKKGPEGQQWSSDYFALEYKLDHLIATYSKPYVAFMDGFTMGGGVGLSVHAPFRIATERTVFAMPETNIGFFPDVGASFFLPRLPGAVGTYLALTSERLSGPNVFYAGLASHYLHSSSLPALEARLAELQFMDYDPYEKRLEIINNAIEEFVTGLPHDQPILIGGNLRRAIDRCFGHDSVADIVAALKAEAATSPDTPYTDDKTRSWAAKTLKTLEHRSPTAVHVALRQMRIGGRWPIGQAFRREHLIASRFMKHPDFTEGVSSLLIRKEKGRPNWKPSTLEEIGDSRAASQAITDPFFGDRDEAKDPELLALLNNRTYSEYPYSAGKDSNVRLGVPTEQDVFEVVSEGGKSPREVVNQLVGRYRGKQGVKEVVAEIVERKTTVTSRGNVEWSA